MSNRDYRELEDRLLRVQCELDIERNKHGTQFDGPALAPGWVSIPEAEYQREQADLAALREAVRWRKWPEEKPPYVGEYNVSVLWPGMMKARPHADIWNGKGWSRYQGTDGERVIAWTCLPEPYVREETTR